jgi:hypothetical protein
MAGEPPMTHPNSYTVKEDRRRSKLLRKAAYWLRDYARCFRTSEEAGAREFYEKLQKIASDCDKVSRDATSEQERR